MGEEQVQRRTTFAVMAIAAVVGVVLVSIGPASGGRSSTTGDRTVTFLDPEPTTESPPETTAGATSVPTTTTAERVADDPGALPQTDERPAATGATFTAGVEGLWQAVRQDRPELGLPSFFPRSAYLQVKAINDPAGDYQQRLIANFEDDVHTLHAQLGANASGAELVGVTVPDDQAVFVQPGEEFNKLPYWRVYGTTVHYRAGGQTGSFPVTSLISWRGQWYVVHLGVIR